jgi:hypothetical protein
LANSAGLNGGDFESGDFDEDFDDLDDFAESAGSSGDFGDDFGDDDLLDTTDKVDVGKIIKSQQVDDNSFAVSLSPEDLEFGVFADEVSDLDEDEDLEEYNEMQSFLKEAGYEDTDDLDFSNVEFLVKREKKLRDEEHEQQVVADAVMYAAEECRSAKELLALSSATLEDSNKIAAVSSDLKSNVFVDDNYSKLSIIVENIINEQKSQHGEVSVDSVFNAIRKRVEYLDRIGDWSTVDLYNALETIVPMLLDSDNVSSMMLQHQESGRKQVANFIMKDEVAISNSMILNANAKKTRVIRQVLQTSDGYVTKCPVCGKQVIMEKVPFAILRVSTETRDSRSGVNKNIFQLPRVYSCECGTDLVFTKDDYKNMFTTAIKSDSKGIDDATQVIPLICKGAAYLKIEPPISIIEKAVPDVFIQKAIGDVAVASIAEDKEVYFVDDLEMKRAGDEFYKRLKCLSVTTRRPIVSDGKQSGKELGEELSEESLAEDDAVAEYLASPYRKISYSEVARYFASVLSKDYDSLHNQALFSLLFYFQENPFLRAKLDYSDIWLLQDNIAFVSEMDVGKGIGAVSAEKLSMLSSMASEALGGKPVQDDEVIKLLKENPEILQQRLDDRFSEYEYWIDKLREGEESLGYCPMINLSSYKLSDFDKYIPSEEVLNLFNSIADRMIVNNLAGDFYSYWEPMKIMNVTTLKSQLTNSSGLAESRKKISKMLEKYVGNNPMFTNNVLTFSYPVIEEHATLREALLYVKGQNFYRFCKEIEKLAVTIDSSFSGEGGSKALDSYVTDHFTTELRLSICRIRDATRDVVSKSEGEYFLSEFSKDEVASIDDRVRHFVFGRWVPKRLEGETPEAFMTRFSEMRESASEVNGFNVHNSYDFSKEFEKFSEDVLNVVLGSNISSITYKSFAPTMFISKIVSELISRYSLDFSKRLLNVSDELLNVIDSDIAGQQNLAVDFNSMQDFNRILNGNYVTGALASVTKLLESYTNRFIYTTDSVYQKDEVFDYAEELNTEVESMLAEDGVDPSRDPDDMLDEIQMYVRSEKMKSLLE